MHGYVIRNNDDNTLFVRAGRKCKYIDVNKYTRLDVYSSETIPQLYNTRKSAQRRLDDLLHEYKTSYSERIAYTKNLEIIEIEIKY